MIVMRKMYMVLISMFCFLTYQGMAQVVPRHVNKPIFNPPVSSLLNGKLMVTDDTSDETILFKIALERWADVVDDPFDVEGELVFYSIFNDSVTVSDKIQFTSADFFPSWSIVTGFKDVNVTLPGSSVYKRGHIYFRYKEKINGIWSETKRSPNWVETTFDRPALPSEISGPDQICDDGVYTISNPGIISLENADGIATLTSLGGNQWKVERMGNANGQVSLKSVDSNAKITSKGITIGGMNNPFINGGKILGQGSFNYDLKGIIDIQNASVNWSVISTTNDVSINVVSNALVTIHVNNWNWSGDNIIRLRAYVTTICGETITIVKTLGAGSGGPIEEV